MHSRRCRKRARAEDPRTILRRQGYQFVAADSSAAVKPCLWCKRVLRGGDSCYKSRFYAIESHRCIQMTPTLQCSQRCLFCWRSFEHEFPDERILTPGEIAGALPHLQKKALSGYKVSPAVTPERFSAALNPCHVAVSLAGEPTLYPHLPELLSLLQVNGYSTFLVTNGTLPDVVARCRPTQLYVSLDAPDRETYEKVCRPVTDTWEKVQESLALLGSRRSAVRITLVAGMNDEKPKAYARLVQDSGATYIEVKGYMYVGYSRQRLTQENMPSHARIQAFAREVAVHAGYRVMDECPESRVVCLEREP